MLQRVRWREEFQPQALEDAQAIRLLLLLDIAAAQGFPCKNMAVRWQLHWNPDLWAVTSDSPAHATHAGQLQVCLPGANTKQPLSSSSGGLPRAQPTHAEAERLVKTTIDMSCGSSYVTGSPATKARRVSRLPLATCCPAAACLRPSSQATAAPRAAVQPHDGVRAGLNISYKLLS